MSQSNICLKSAWLITWEWVGDAAATGDRVAGILNYRTSKKRVIDIVEFLYSLHTANLGELAAYAKNKKNNVWKAEKGFSGPIRCGRHPYLVATYARNIEVSVDPVTKFETIRWETGPIYEPTDVGPKLAIEPRQECFTRKITGPLSFKTLWDPRLNKMKDKFTDNEDTGE